MCLTLGNIDNENYEFSAKATHFRNKQNELHFICPQLFQSYDLLTKSVQNIVHLHERTLSVTSSLPLMVTEITFCCRLSQTLIEVLLRQLEIA